MQQLTADFREHGLPASKRHIDSTIESLTVAQHSEGDRARYGDGIAHMLVDGRVTLKTDVIASHQTSATFAHAVDDII